MNENNVIPMTPTDLLSALSVRGYAFVFSDALDAWVTATKADLRNVIRDRLAVDSEWVVLVHRDELNNLWIGGAPD